MTTHDWIAPGEQGFLTGDSLYLRAWELADAAFAATWRFSPYPITRQQAEKVLKEEVPKQADRGTNLLIACRRCDDTPVGAAVVDEADRRTAEVRLRANPALGDDAGAIKAEIIRILIPWLGTERNAMVIWLDLDGPSPEELAAVAAVGLRPAARLREAVWRDGARVDRWIYEWLHPFWREKLGDPGPGIDAATEPPTSATGSRRVSLKHPTGPVPDGAILVSERLALRISNPDDGKTIARLVRAETDPSWSRGRWLLSPLHIESELEALNAEDPPSTIYLSIIQRQTGDYLGEVELMDFDHFNRTAETGSVIYVPELRGQGYGTEAKNLLLEYAFDHLNLHMIRSFVWSFNPRSQAALAKQGYRTAGRLQWRAYTAQGVVNNVVFDLLAREWRARVETAAAPG